MKSIKDIYKIGKGPSSSHTMGPAFAVEHILNKYSKDISINDSLGYDKDGNSIMIQDVLKTEDVNFCEDIELKDNIKLLYKYLDVLNPRERDIINSRYGLNNSSSLTQKKISKRLGISRSYVSRIEKRAITKILREFIKKYVKYGDSTNILYRVDSGRIRPSKKLQDTLAAMLEGNEKFERLFRNCGKTDGNT